MDMGTEPDRDADRGGITIDAATRPLKVRSGTQREELLHSAPLVYAGFS